MSHTDWPKEEVQQLAESSGRPLEVACAQAFLAAGWSARLGAHFARGALDEDRELDVLAVKEERLLARSGVTVRLRALISCRGFPSERLHSHIRFPAVVFRALHRAYSRVIGRPKPFKEYNTARCPVLKSMARPNYFA